MTRKKKLEEGLDNLFPESEEDPSPPEPETQPEEKAQPKRKTPSRSRRKPPAPTPEPENEAAPESETKPARKRRTSSRSKGKTTADAATADAATADAATADAATANVAASPAEPEDGAENSMPDMADIPDMNAIREQSEQLLREAIEELDHEKDKIRASKGTQMPALHTQTTSPEVQEKTQHLVIFQLAGEIYSVHIAAVEQIIELPRITCVPHTPDYIAGLTNLRGTVLPVVDLRMRLGLAAAEPTRETRIVVAQVHGVRIGMIVDAVIEVRHVPEASIEPPSPLVTSVESAYIAGVVKLMDDGQIRGSGRLVTLLDLDHILPGVVPT